MSQNTIATPEVEIIRSRRKTIAIQITQDLRVIVRAPSKMPIADISAFVQAKSKWITKHLQSMHSRLSQTESAAKLSPNDLESLKNAASVDLTARIAKFAESMHVTYGKITIRSQRSRWGSCSAKGNLSFNCLLMLAPPEVRDYVVVHELCHRMHMNHKTAFWDAVRVVIPDYKQYKDWLKENGSSLISQLP